MKTRILTALAGMPLVLAAVLFAPPALFGALVLAVALLALGEYLRLCGADRLVSVLSLASLAALLAALPAGVLPQAGGAVVVLLAAGSLWRAGDPARRFAGLAAAVLGLCYIGYAMGSLWLLRATAHGTGWVLLVLAATWAGDSAAYFVGSRFGRRRLAPVLSPKKTWEGAAGGLAGSVAGAFAALPLLDGTAGPAVVAGVGLAVGVAGQVGDLFESLWKRACGVKDSGTLIPGHGGVLDRVDSLLLALPVCHHLVRALGR